MNLGCGAQELEGFINCDLYVDGTKPNFKKCDIRQLPFESNTADYVLLDNVLEHLPQHDIPMVLYEVRRVLKPGGRCVIAVPDFGFICRQWIEMERGSFNPVLHKWVAETAFGNQLHEGEYHRTPMSGPFLNYMLQLVGFRTYTMTMYPCNTPMPSCKDYPGVNPSENEFNVMRNDSIYVDIRK